MQVPSFPPDLMRSMQAEDDSVSTFHPGNTINLTKEQDDDEEIDAPPIASKTAPVSILKP
jgi:hypothetical protein